MTDDPRLEELLHRYYEAGPARNEPVPERFLAKLGSLPPQQRAFAWWPAALMNWDFAPAWPRVAALAGAAVLGISIGLSNIGTRIAADLDLVRVASAEDAGANVFDVDSVTGLRP
ncbi:MAG: hypothetical protein QOF14_3221 [Hyphomicrobiales bacterium]|jgi:hypothetical protein|nr:hypothetical protein [Hyphomicrobiales bacterium]